MYDIEGTEIIVRALAAQREDAAKLKQAIRERKEFILANDGILADDEKQLEELNSYIESNENELRTRAVAAYRVTGNKKPFGGVEVKNFKVRSFAYDPNSAKRWCLSNLTPALKLDAKTFEKAIESGDVPAEVATMAETDEPRAQIATDLGKFLGAE